MTKYASNNRLNRSNVNAAGMSPKTRKKVSIFAFPVPSSQSKWVF